MCSFVRVGSPKGLKLPKELGTSLETGTGFPSEMNAVGGMRLSERNSPLSMGIGLTQEEKDDLGERVFVGTKSPTELGLRNGLGTEDSPWRESPLVRNKYEERMSSSETISPLNKGLEMRLKRQDLSRTLMERSNLGVNRCSASQETKPLGMLPERVGLENECLRSPCSGRVMRPPLGKVCASPQALGSRGGPVAGAPEGLGALGVEPSRELKEEPTCAVVQSSVEMKPAVEVDIGLPQPEDPGAMKNTESQMGLVIEPPECLFAQQPEEKMDAENIEPGVEPTDHIRPIYSGKFFDRLPCCPSAGKVIPVGYRVATCLTEKLPRPITPPEAKKFFNFRYPPPGAERVFYGRANDPQIAPYLTHGIRSKISLPAKILINPQPITTFQQKIKDKKESIYFSNQRAPLGKSHDQSPGLPKGLDILKTTFGTAVIREIPARDVVNPPKSYEDVFKEGDEKHDLYVVSHNDYYVGEAKTRNYPSNFHRFDLYGAPTPHFNDGRTMAKTLYWLHELQMKKGAKFISKRVDDFKEKFQHKLGRVLDPIAETMNVPPDHTFGVCLRPDDYGADDLIYNRLPGEYLRGKDRQRALVAAARHHLKNVNYQNFDTLLAAFRHYDKQKGDGVIDKAELREACEQANLHLDEKLLDQLFDYCDVDDDGLINYLEFANFLNWKDKLPLKEYEERVVIKGRKPDCANTAEAHVEESEPALLIKPEDIVLKRSSEKTLRTLQRPSVQGSSHYKTTSSDISAVVGAVPSICYPIYGVPTVRSDIPAPRIRRISDRMNYGEEGNAYSLLHPTIFSQKGVFERDFFQTRSKKEITEILCNIGVKLSDEEFENVWNLASKKHYRGEVCIENIRNVLDELRHADRIKCKRTM
uniref:EF-hand domain family member B n=1 Tax=Molossus molossus TaxID=27622 RepID=A0A7J8DAU4_MOLMO|nr:EF-hand domain family member B [Molossus molossus]